MTERYETERETAIGLLKRISSLESQLARHAGRANRAETRVAELEAEVASLSKLAKLASPADLAPRPATIMEVLEATIIAQRAHAESNIRSQRMKAVWRAKKAREAAAVASQ